MSEDYDIQEIIEDIIKRCPAMIYCKSDGRYYVYDKKTGLYRQRDRHEMYKHIGAYINKNGKYNMTWDARNMSYIYDHLKLKLPYPAMMGADTNAIHLQNGVFLLDKMQFGSFDPKYHATAALPFCYDPDAKSPVFDCFVQEVSGSPAMADTLVEIAGCVLAGETKHEKLLLNIGGGANGKSVYLQLLCSLLGRGLVTNIPVSEINGKRAFVLHELAGKRLNALHELENGITLHKLFDSNVKSIVTNEELNAEVKGGQRYSFRPDMNFIVNTNYLPAIASKDISYSVMRRYLILRWQRIFLPEEQDKNLLDKLTAELPGIFNRALKGLERMRANAFVFSAQEESDAYFKECIARNNPVYGFVTACVSADSGSRVFYDDLRNSYLLWVKQKKIHVSGISQNGMSRELRKSIKAQGIPIDSGKSNGKRYIKGIALKGGDSYGESDKK